MENDKKSAYLTFIPNNADEEMQVQMGTKGGCKAITIATQKPLRNNLEKS